MDDVKKMIDEGDLQLKKGDWESASGTFERILKVLDGRALKDEEMTVLSEVLRKKAHADSRMGEFERAVAHMKRSLDISTDIKDQRGEADSLRGLGYVHWQKGDSQMALIFYEQSLTKGGECGDMEIIGRTRIEIGNAYNYMGDYERAREEYKQAITILKATGNKNELARAFNNLGDCHIRTGDLEDAADILRECMEIATDIGDDTIKGWAAFNVADCFTRMGETRMAKEYLDTALDLLEKSDDRIGVVNALNVYGMTFTAEKEFVLAEDSFGKALILVRDLDIKGLEGEVLRSFAQMFISKGDTTRAKDLLKQAIEAFGSVNRDSDVDEARNLLGKLERA
jgi:tetratricopeptide (TPR) repeat protein